MPIRIVDDNSFNINQAKNSLLKFIKNNLTKKSEMSRLISIQRDEIDFKLKYIKLETDLLNAWYSAITIGKTTFISNNKTFSTRNGYIQKTGFLNVPVSEYPFEYFLSLKNYNKRKISSDKSHLKYLSENKKSSAVVNRYNRYIENNSNIVNAWTKAINNINPYFKNGQFEYSSNTGEIFSSL